MAVVHAVANATAVRADPSPCCPGNQVNLQWSQTGRGGSCSGCLRTLAKVGHSWYVTGSPAWSQAVYQQQMHSLNTQIASAQFLQATPRIMVSRIPVQTMAVSLRGHKHGDPCPGCAAPLKTLFTDPYCPNDCDRVPEPVPPALEVTQPTCTAHGKVCFAALDGQLICVGCNQPVS